MAFGQHPGPPATARQIQHLTQLVHQAGHVDFRDARGPLGLNQRQAGGRFTRDEADALIAQLESAVESGTDEQDDAPSNPPREASAAIDRRQAERAGQLSKVPSEMLAAELQQRGWVVIEP
jgi:hypothetical protein